MIAILSIGTEITTGQILNTNAQWISAELLALGVPTSYQLTVPDHPFEIKAALEFLERDSTIIIVTGGLGPTADDFTRKILAEYYHRPLVWNEDNWKKVQDKLNSRHVTIRSLHRQQCEYPEGSRILSNGVGIADGFTFKVQPSLNSSKKLQEIYALPGPPKELIDIWKNHIEDPMRLLIPESLQWVQKIWTTKGLPESEVASLINETLGIEASSQVLYRVNTPYIEVKFLYRKKDAAIYEAYGQKITPILGPWLYEK